MRARLAALVLALLCGCRGPSEAPPAKVRAPDAAPAPDAASLAKPTAPPADWQAIHAAEDTCGDCHPDAVDAWRASPMGRSLTPLGPGVEPPPGLPAAITHPATGLRYGAATTPEGRIAFAERAEGFEHAQVAGLAVGSGMHTISYLWRRGGALFEAPLTWYAQRGRWDLSPGYDRADHPGMFRAVRADCLYCHADPIPLVPDTVDRFAGEPGPIGCGRCHGDASAHASARAAGRDAPVVVPTRLPPDREAAVCEYCHLQGDVRLLREGRAWSDFVPGMALEEVVAVFVRQRPDAGFGIASHGARLRLSRCAPAGGDRLTCTQCHRPHGEAPPDRSAACRDCHGGDGGHACTGPAEADCARCHMPKRATTDIPHVQVTDHFIRARPDAAEADPVPDAPLVWVAHPTEAPADPEHQLLLGRAYTEAWRAGGRPADLERAAHWLAAGLAGRPESPEGWYDQATVHQAQGRADLALAAIERAFARRPGDGRIALATAERRLAGGDAAGAVAAATRGLAATPDQGPLRTARAKAHLAAGGLPAALADAQAALALEPGDGAAWSVVGVAALARGDRAGAEGAFRNATRRAPDHQESWMALCHLESARGEHAACRGYAALLRRKGRHAEAAAVEARLATPAP